MRIYNLFPRLAGKFADWTPHLERAAAMGFDWVFVNPLQRTGSSRSLYSIADYFELDPCFADRLGPESAAAQFARVAGEAARLGLRLMADLVINHCAIDSPLVRRRPEWFEREPDGSVALARCAEEGREVVWRDLARFAHDRTSDPEGLYEHFRSVARHLVGQGFAGLRCDAAYQVSPDLWRRLIADTRRENPDVIFVAETLGCTADQTRRTAEAGFDYVFNSVKWWDFHSPWLLEQYQLVRETAPSVGFPESHDTERLAAESGGNVDALRQRYLFAALFSAGVLLPVGAEFGFRRRLDVVRTRPQDWEEHTGIDLRGFISEVNAIKSRHRIFQEDCLTQFLSSGNPQVLVMWKASARSREEALLILNKDALGRQRFECSNLGALIQAGLPLGDISPEERLDFLPAPFSYDLRPGQGLVLLTRRDP